jgi:chemotaxis protein CheC
VYTAPLTIEHLTALTELERAALGEVSNIAMARAANSLRQMVEHEVLLSVPAVEILSRDQATQLVAKPDNPNLVAVRQDFSGAFAGRALLIFPEANSLEEIRGYVALLMDIPSMDELRLLIADFVSSVTRKSRLDPGPLESPT